MTLEMTLLAFCTIGVFGVAFLPKSGNPTSLHFWIQSAIGWSLIIGSAFLIVALFVVNWNVISTEWIMPPSPLK